MTVECTCNENLAKSVTYMLQIYEKIAMASNKSEKKLLRKRNFNNFGLVERPKTKLTYPRRSPVWWRLPSMSPDRIWPGSTGPRRIEPRRWSTSRQRFLEFRIFNFLIFSVQKAAALQTSPTVADKITFEIDAFFLFLLCCPPKNCHIATSTAPARTRNLPNTQASFKKVLLRSK